MGGGWSDEVARSSLSLSSLFPSHIPSQIANNLPLRQLTSLQVSLKCFLKVDGNRDEDEVDVDVEVLFVIECVRRFLLMTPRFGILSSHRFIST